MWELLYLLASSKHHTQQAIEEMRVLEANKHVMSQLDAMDRAKATYVAAKYLIYLPGKTLQLSALKEAAQKMVLYSRLMLGIYESVLDPQKSCAKMQACVNLFNGSSYAYYAHEELNEYAGMIFAAGDQRVLEMVTAHGTLVDSGLAVKADVVVISEECIVLRSSCCVRFL
jgi:hypothetical protein